MDVKVANGRLKETTAGEYRRLLRCYVLDDFGGKAIGGIAPRHCEDFLGELVGRGISPKTVGHAWSAFKRVLKYALQHDAIKSNPAERVEYGGGHAVGDHEKFEHHPLTGEQVGRVAAIVGERYPDYELMVLFLAYSGLRSAECSGLELADLAFTTRPNETRCQVQVRRTKARRGGVWLTTTPKSRRSRRTVPLPPWLAERMRTYVAVHPRGDDAVAPLWPSRGVGGNRAKGQRAVAPLDWSEPVHLSTFYDTILRPAYVEAGLPISQPATATAAAVRGVRLHDLRHTFADDAADGGRALSTSESLARSWPGFADFRRVRRLDSGRGRRRGQSTTRTNRPGSGDNIRAHRNFERGAVVWATVELVSGVLVF